MSSMYSSSWYRVANLAPQLRNHVEIHRQPYGDQTTYLLQDHSNGKLFRFNIIAYDFIGRMDGKKTVHDIWQLMLAAMGDDAPSQDDVIGILSRLHSSDALRGNVTPDCIELFNRSEKQRRTKWLQKLRNPMSIRVPLFDPDKLLTTLNPLTGLFFTKSGFIIWLMVVVTALIHAAPQWLALKNYAVINAFEVDNLIMLGFIYPIVKGLHEFGHALSTKKWGGEVHEIGITFLVFIPVPYVDASSSAVCKYKQQRVIVSAAGMMVELFIASLALFLWINVEDSMVRAVAFNVMLIASVSTVIFNGNPLLKFDAYYILEDLIEVPNLASRSSRYMAFLIQHYVFRIEHTISPLGRSGERFWFISYGILSTLYRWFISITIIWFVAGKYFIVGVLLAIWAAITQFILPIWKAIAFVLFDPRLKRRRIFSLSVTSGALASVVYVVCVVPLPMATNAQGVLFPPEDAEIKATNDGFLHDMLVEPFADVTTNQALFTLDEPLLRSELAVLKAEYDELKVRYRISSTNDLFESKLIQEKIISKHAELKRIQERINNMTISSPLSGRYIPLSFDDQHNRYVRKGESMGYIVGKKSMTIQVAIPQKQIGRLREGVEDVSVKLSNDIGVTYSGKIIREVPSAQNYLQSKVLGSVGGGRITVDPGDENGVNTIDSVFHYEVALDKPLHDAPIGLRAHVRFYHGEEPLAMQCYRIARQLFLGRFGV